MKFQNKLEIQLEKPHKASFNTCYLCIQNYCHLHLFMQRERNGNYMFKYNDYMIQNIILINKLFKIQYV